MISSVLSRLIYRLYCSVAEFNILEDSDVGVGDARKGLRDLRQLSTRQSN